VVLRNRCAPAAAISRRARSGAGCGLMQNWTRLPCRRSASGLWAAPCEAASLWPAALRACPA